MRWINERPHLAVAGVLLLAAALRFQGVSQPYVDEYAWRQADTASVAEAFAAGNWNIFLPQVRWGGAGPNYIGAEFQLVSYLAALGYRAFGVEPWIGRAVSISFGLWGIFALYHLVRRVWDHPRAIASAAVMAVLPGSVFTERSFLPDGPMTAMMTTSLWMLVAFGQSGRHRYLWAAAFAGALGCLTKLPGGILILPASYALVALLRDRLGDRRLQLRLAAAALAVALPVLLYYLWARHVALSNPPYHFAGEGKFLWHSGVAAWMEKGYFLHELWRIAVTRDAYWGYGFVALTAAGLLMSPRLRRLSAAPWLFHFWLLAMVVRYGIEAAHLVADPYNLHLFHVPVAAFAGHALVLLGDPSAPTWRPGRVLVAAIIFAASALAAQLQSRHLYEGSYRLHQVLGQTLASMSARSDLVVSAGPEPVVLYFSQRNGWLFPVVEGLPGSASSRQGVWDHGAADLAQLRELRARGARWLVVPAWNGYTGASGEEFLRSNYPVLYAGVLRDFELVHASGAGVVFRVR